MSIGSEVLIYLSFLLKAPMNFAKREILVFIKSKANYSKQRLHLVKAFAKILAVNNDHQSDFIILHIMKDEGTKNAQMVKNYPFFKVLLRSLYLLVLKWIESKWKLQVTLNWSPGSKRKHTCEITRLEIASEKRGWGAWTCSS